MRIFVSMLVAIAIAATVSAQSLAEAARKEKKRREDNRRSGVAVRVISEDEIRSEPAVVTRPGADVDPSTATELPPEPSDLSSVGAPAPDFSLPDRSGRTVSLRDFHGRPLLIDFWATWCGPCKETMPEIQKLYRQYRGRLQIVGINIEGVSPEVSAYLDEGGYTFPVLFDSGNWNAPTLNRFGVDSIPRTFLIDRAGNVVFEGHPRGLTEERIQAALAAR